MYRMIGADGREYGPISAALLRQWIAENRANASSRVLAEGSNEWKLLGSLPEFSMLFAAAPAPSAPVGQLQKTNGLAIAGFIFGLVSFMTMPAAIACCCFGPVFNLLGIVFSSTGLSQINRNPQLYTGRALAIAGLVLSIVCLVLYLVLLVLAVISTQWQGGISHHVHRL
jgi:hypothetical protein